MTEDEKYCIWIYEWNIQEDCWNTSCENSFVLIVGTPLSNGMRFCCYCGKPLIEKIFKEPEEETEE